MKIREAVLADAPGIAQVHVDSWRTTYSGIIPSQYLANLSYEKRTDLWKRNIARADNFVVGAETNEGKIIGFADALERETNTVDHSSDLTSIYLLKEYQRLGTGKKLMNELFHHFTQMEVSKVFVEVLEANPTRFFYEYYGAELVETLQMEIGGVTLTELVYEWDDLEDVLARL
ncbi:GNAT family N-acetyltransferase [Sporosarcina trichiuri]|uniref:GNAT family N-acetyltransferase n=1 Tax=Sporosarcina trichiuri TaxID=3056445 RepID=UPI0025B2BF06|nr:GNAT family N-acetyltransferase [Sporosarcina sp. 0.2-SM1T-5]WJY27301.1 GNAT family N-acetyltransferase [Sporosarcina sp. 0.2-SM1T-5]